MAGYKNASPRRRCMGVRGKKKEEKKKTSGEGKPRAAGQENRKKKARDVRQLVPGKHI